MTPLTARLARLIEIGGPIPMAQFMAEALSAPDYGYYATRDPFGVSGDFITAPEISQMFGELIGLWCAQTWQAMGRPLPVNLIELGPGRGTLMVDLIRAAATVPDFREALHIHFVETSPSLRARQESAVSASANFPPVSWHGRLTAVPTGAFLLIANEFFDALPVHQFVMTEAGWRERLVSWDHDRARFAVVTATAPTPACALATKRWSAAKPGQIQEISAAGATLSAEIGARLTRDAGAALIIDFVRADHHGATVQAVRNHQSVDPFEAVGCSDIAAAVDFGGLATAARASGARCHGPVSQSVILTALGLETRAAMLRQRASAGQRSAIDQAVHRLTAPDQMGALFQALAITSPDLATPAGFESGANTPC